METKKTIDPSKRSLLDRLKKLRPKNRVEEMIETMSEEDFFTRTSDSFGKLIAKRFFKNKLAIAGLVIILTLITVSILAPVICPYPAEESHLELLTTGKPLKPSKQFIWGTDQLGRDYFTRCIYGGRVSLFVGFTAVLIEMAIGLPIGIIAGYFGGWVDTILMRILEVINSIPTFLIIIIIAAGLERSIWNVIWVLGVFYWPSFVRLIRAYFLSLKQQDFIQAAKALGIKPFAIIIRHMLPAVAMPILIQASSAVVGAVFAESSLSYLGFGIMEPTPTWGAMLSKSTQYLRFVPTMSLFPGLLITLVTLSMNFIADGLRDAFDPRSRS